MNCHHLDTENGVSLIPEEGESSVFSVNSEKITADQKLERNSAAGNKFS